MSGITFDTGALIALERGDKRMRARFANATDSGIVVTVPSVVLAEWWRGDTKVRRWVLDSVDVEYVSEHVCKLAGEAIAAIPSATAVDAIVMASAARRGDVVCTGDIEDLDRLHSHFRGVHKLLRV